ncbi:C6 transcription factor, putative [Talaromyces stipitatus ATCC 10500]|uniref:C6 transcription factor, putative n=1 Tax=Talaromyces stipitatus (strain ATCC 10500 / CBS 375.48 / QM 6759 / NRRL 1006) TaxID=441959 RepID=B8M1A6_TALSN|nr:C6 transcription factor, putative [Talaromyces stipitatus ATCC 10500]EED21048.1 C6 transcription factor, putative [Talaromyces stipitatus ATCC 10500]
MTNTAAAGRRTSDKGANFRGQLGRFRLNPTVSSSQIPTSSPSSQSQPQLSNGLHTPVVSQRPEPSASSVSSTSTATIRRRASRSDSPDAAGNDRDGPVNKSKRVSTACEFCRKRKKKCDFRYPNCSACTRAGVVCTVLTLGQSVAHQPVPRDQIENLEKRVEWLEELLRTQANIDVTGKSTGSVVEYPQADSPAAEQWFNVPVMLAQPRAGIGLTAAVDDTSDSANSTNSPTTLSSMDGGQLPNISEIFRDKLENRRSIVPRPASSSVIPPVRRLSSWDEAEQLVNRYFEGVGMQYPFLHKTEFMRGMRAIYQNKSVPPDVQNSYHITMAVALLTTTNDIQQAAAFYGIARETLTPTLQNEDRVSLQALLSLALYSLSSPAGPSIWQVLGTAMRLATSLGLHKARPASTSTKDMVEHEMDKRAFWSLYNLDRLISVTLSRPLGLSDDDITINTPVEYDENWVEAPRNCQMSISVQVVKLRRIYSRIYRCFYNPHTKPTGDVAPLLQGFRQELDEWRTSAPVIQTCLHYSTAYYDFLYYTTLLLLYRPSVLMPHPDSNSIMGCGEASIRIIQSYWDNYSANKIKWLWITLCHVYSAGVTMLWCLEQDIRAVRRGMSPIWANPQVYSSLEFVHTLLDEFCAKRKGADRLSIQFKTQSQQVTRRMLQATADQQQQQQQALESVVQQQLQQPIFMPTTVDPGMIVHPMFYSYQWAGQEIASFYGL